MLSYPIRTIVIITALCLYPSLTALQAIAQSSESGGKVERSAMNEGAVEVRLSKKSAEEIGHKVWLNECGGRVAGLTSWNVGENFPSLGIGHFIWYPEGATDPFEESFPKMVGFLQQHGIKLPGWLTPETKCPWHERAEFLRDANGEKLSELRNMLASSVPEQTQYLVYRLEGALPKILDAAPVGDREKLRKHFYSVLRSGAGGAYALIDYVNFKGEGVNERERYNGEGWGLLQVLSHMSDSGTPLVQFAASAKSRLELRVKNSPPERHEERWLNGWLKRVNSYNAAG